MLRSALMVVAVLLVLAGIVASVSGAQGALVMTFWGLILFAAVMLERWRYRKASTERPSEWRDTNERFVDPETGQLTQVMYDPRTGDRRYRPVIDDEKSS